MSIEAMKQALEALEFDSFYATSKEKAVTSLRQAITEAEKQEPEAAPVAKNEGGRITWMIDDWPQNCLLYTHPQPKREWVWMTDDDLERTKLLCFEIETNAQGEEQEVVNLNQLLRAAEQICKENNCE